MNRKLLATALLCIGLLLPAFPIASAVSSGESEASGVYDVRMHPTYSTLSLEQLLGLPDYVRVNEEPSDSIGKDYAFEPMIIYMDGGGGGAPPPKPAPVNTMVIVDDDAALFLGVVTVDPTIGWKQVYEWAATVLEVGDDPFWTSFSIDFVAVDFQYGESPNIPTSSTFTDMYSLLAWAIATFPKPSGVDVRYVLTGQNTYPILGIAYGDTIVVSACAAVYLIPLQNVWQHEASHLYFAKDHVWYDFTTVCIMNGWYVPFTRVWCSGCSSTISLNKYRFG